MSHWYPIRALAALAGLAFIFTGTPALAQEDPEVFNEKIEKEQESDTDDVGWDALLSVGASAAFASNSDVVGQVDGISTTLGYNVQAGIFYIKGMHDWRNRGSLVGQFTRTPIIDEFVKTGDSLKLESVYYLRIWNWFGPFARFSLETQVLKGTDVQASNTSYATVEGTDADGNTIYEYKGTDVDRLHMTDAFTPLTLKESIGAFLRPLTMKMLEVELRAGLGARQVFADGQLALSDNGDTADVIEVIELENSAIVGAETGIYLNGKLAGDRVTYSAFAEALFPFIGPSEFGAVDGANIDTGLKLSFKLVEWASLDYEFKAFRQPQLAEVWQVQNQLLLSIGWTLLESEVK